MEISEEFSESNNRSKRPRTSSSASSSGGGYAGEFNRNSSLYSSPSSSSGISTSTEEDEDMANCLILLARGGLQTTNEEKNKFSRRRSTEITAEYDAATNGKLGIYVYECKTCNRAFPSFQALGGHRASHKRIKSSVDDVRKKSPQSAAETTEYEAGEGKFVTSDGVTPPISTRLMNKCLNKTKIHECSICGSEFGSGQALGGHMRRHRSATNSNTARSANGSWSQDEIGEKTRGMLGLDLNLPATPENDDGSDGEFHDKQPCLVFSAAVLVDCHY